ncbi:protein of unknown function [Thiohalospira halophila DSM 15071]|uniref:DUF4168 domain-containing protein n=1 Tax=Thiohalospira halophila DSM 15071 TaxID=1123397 RepID=A0A1I1VD68_9GAMM|nr:DUF4168 domain-containing protein [Thiohalospira halophila]SFD79918.1 protein of unknown function [Thiohalospira halophila DSM 15071]
MQYRSTILALLAAGALATAPAAFGQAQQQGQGAPNMEMNAETLDSFADAYVEVRDIQSDFADQLGSVEDREKAQSLQREAQEEMVSAVEDAGLSVQEYNQVASQMQNDPELREKVMQRTEN